MILDAFLSTLAWFPATYLAVFAAVFALAILDFEFTYARNLARAMDKTIAAVLGWTGNYTVSAECAVRKSIFCQGLRAILDSIDPDHCGKAARKEGLL